MDVQYTQKIFYRKFPYKIVICRKYNIKNKSWNLGWTPKKSMIWLNKNNVNYRSNCRLRRRGSKITATMRLFLENESDYNTCLNKWKKHITAVVRPLNENHENTLKNNEKIIIRPTLLYGKFRYVVRFRWPRNLKESKELKEWLLDNFSPSNESCQFKLRLSNWRPKVYINDLGELTLIKLTWSECIAEITAIKTLDELESEKIHK